MKKITLLLTAAVMLVLSSCSVDPNSYVGSWEYEKTEYNEDFNEKNKEFYEAMLSSTTYDFETETKGTVNFSVMGIGKSVPFTVEKEGDVNLMKSDEMAQQQISLENGKLKIVQGLTGTIYFTR